MYIEINAVGLACPKPVINTKKEIRKIFLNKDNIIFSDIVKLIKTDLQYQKIQKSLREKEFFS
jgi:TusA-related sulfurtransferase